MTKYRIPKCLACADGTLLPLTYAPRSIDAPDYSGRQYAYSITCMIVNDDQKRVRYFNAGFPGSAHDQHEYLHTKLHKSPTDYFGDNLDYFLVTDSAMKSSSTVIPCFKAPRGHELTSDQSKFNNITRKTRSV